MSYTVKKLAKFSGVSVRTLRFYDEIGLLKPAYYGANKYRYYEEEQLLILQQILFYRELGFPLNEIQRILTSDEFDKITALNAHRHVLEQDLKQKKKLIQTIDKTIAHLRGKTKMSDHEIFSGFDSVRPRESKKQKEYEKFLMEKGITSQQNLDESWDKVKDWTKEDWEKYKHDADALFQKIADAMNKHALPESEEVQNLIRQLFNHIRHFYVPTKESFIALGELYCEHADFRRYYANYHPEMPEFLALAMQIFAERKLS